MTEEIKLTNPDERISVYEYKGKKIIEENYSNLGPEDIIAVFNKAPKYIRAEPKGSVLNLVRVTDARYNSEVIDVMKKISKEDKPYIKKTAVLGIDGLKRILLKAISIFSGRGFQVFDEEEAAKEWLVSD